MEGRLLPDRSLKAAASMRIDATPFRVWSCSPKGMNWRDLS